jgi:hypothetical protein
LPSAIDICDQWTDAMLHGDFERAWKLSDLSPICPHRLEELTGKRILLRCEHGLGDTIQFIRYAPRLRRVAAHIIAHVQPRLVPLVRRLPEIDRVFTWNQPWPGGEYDCEIEIMDLPYLFRTTLDTIPREVPYLSLDPALPGPPHGGIGLQWSSGDWNARRSLPVSALAPLRRLPGIELVSLQDGPETPDVTASAAIMSLDLVITVDTMVAHLAGALGKPVWVLLPYEADWRWMLDRDDSPWYPTMRLFRQDETRDWTPVVARVAAEWCTLAAGWQPARRWQRRRTNPRWKF